MASLNPIHSKLIHFPANFVISFLFRVESSVFCFYVGVARQSKGIRVIGRLIVFNV